MRTLIKENPLDMMYYTNKLKIHALMSIILSTLQEKDMLAQLFHHQYQADAGDLVHTSNQLIDEILEKENEDSEAQQQVPIVVTEDET